MLRRTLWTVFAGMGIGLGLLAALSTRAAADAVMPQLTVPYEPSPPKVVETMLKLAKVGKDDVVCDLGCGDGRIVVMAVKKFDAKKALGIDIDPERIRECKENAEGAGVADKVQFIHGSIFDADLKGVSVVTCYLLPNVNVAMRPIIFRDLKPGHRVVSHAFTMGEWEHDATAQHPRARGGIVYLWIIPAPVGGAWEWATKGKNGDVKWGLALEQEFQVARGSLSVAGGEAARISDVTLSGTELAFTALAQVDGQSARIAYRGSVDGDTIKGTQEWKSGPNAGTREWIATRKPVDLVGSWQVELKSPEQQDLNGTLEITRKPGCLAATYAAGRDKKPIPISAFYVWGSSVRFDLPSDAGRSAEFKGTFAAEAGAGVAHVDGGNDVPWTAKRAK